MCNVACNECSGSEASDCITCASGYSDYDGTCLNCNVACNGCTGVGAENCIVCSTGYYNYLGVC